MNSSSLDHFVFTQTKVLVFTTEKDQVKASVIESRCGQGLFCISQVSKKIIHSEGVLQFGKNPSFITLDSIFQELQSKLQEQIHEIDMIICTTNELAKCSIYSLLTGLDESIPDPGFFQSTIKPFSLLPTVGEWMMKRFNFRHDCRVMNSLSDIMASYLFCPVAPNDIVLLLSTSDKLLVPVQSNQVGKSIIMSNPFYSLNNHRSDNNGHLPFLAQIQCQGFGKARNTIREEYTKTWKAFKQLVQVVSPGGTAGLDDKLFLFFLFDDQDELQSVRRYEQGTCVSEFNDLRANPRTSLEGQALYVRKRLSELKEKEEQTSIDKSNGYWGASNCLSFQPFHKKRIPDKCWIISNENSKVETECVADVMGQVIGAPCFINSGNNNTGITQSCIGATYFCLFQQHIDRGKTEISYEDFVHLLQQKQLAYTISTRSPTPISSPTTSNTTLMDEHQRTPRASRRKPSLFPSPHVHFSLERGDSRDSTPTIKTRVNRAISSAALLKEEENIQDVDTTPKLRQRQRSVSLSASTIYSSPPSSTFGQVLSPPNSLHSENTNEGDEEPKRINTEFTSINSSDEDLWLFYGALLEEYARLWDSVQRIRTNFTLPSP